MKITKTDIFLNNSQVIVNPVNCIGIMGAGLAKQFKVKYPDNELAYKEHCYYGYMKPGEIFAFNVDKNLTILNAATKNHWKNPSRVEWIQKCLENIARYCIFEFVESISIPLIGCGLGGIKFEEVKSDFEKFYEELQIHGIHVSICNR